MVRHEDIAEDVEMVFPACVLEDLLEEVAGGWSFEDVGVAVATDSDEVEMSGGLVTKEALGHSGSLEEGGRASLR